MKLTIPLSLSLLSLSLSRFGLHTCHESGSAPCRDEPRLEVSLEVSVQGPSISKAGRGRGERKVQFEWKLNKCWTGRWKNGYTDGDKGMINRAGKTQTSRSRFFFLPQRRFAVPCP